MYKWEELKQANESIVTTDVKGKEYAEVNQRIKAFRMVCPQGAIITEMVSNENGVCVFKATILNDEQVILGTGTAYEKESSSFINKTSYIENCETSAVGRALGMCGFGINTSVASFEEVTNAINNQEDKGNKQEDKGKKSDITKEMVARLFILADETKTDRFEMLKAYKVDNPYNLKKTQYEQLVKILEERKANQELSDSLDEMLDDSAYEDKNLGL